MATTPVAPPPAAAPSAPPPSPSSAPSAAPSASPSQGSGSTSTPSSPTSAPRSIASRIREALLAPDGPSQTETEQQAQPAADDAASAIQAEPETAPTGENVEQQAQPQQQEEEDIFAQFEPDSEEPPQTLDALLKTDRGRKIYQGYKFARELQKATHEGGVGHMPSVSQVREYFFSHADKMAMENDYLAAAQGDPASLQRFTSHWFDQNRGPASAAMARNLVTNLQQANPEAYVEAAIPVVSTYEQSLWQRWEAETNPDVKEALWVAAQMVHKDMTGEWNRDVNAPPQTGQPGQDPLAAQRAELQAGFRQLMQAQQAQATARAQQWNNDAFQQVNGVFLSAVDQALKPLKGSVSEKVYNALRSDFAKDVKQSATRDPEVWRLFTTRIGEAQRAGSPDAIRGLVDHYMQIVMPVIGQKRKAFLQEAGIAIKQQSDQRHEQLRQVAANKAPANGAPVQKSVMPGTQRQQGESYEAYTARRIKESLSQ